MYLFIIFTYHKINISPSNVTNLRAIATVTPCASPIIGAIKNIITVSLTPIPPGAPGTTNPVNHAIENITIIFPASKN